MAMKHVTPTFGSESFSCPNCGALAHQDWFRLHVSNWDKPFLPTIEDLIRAKEDVAGTAKAKTKLVQHIEKYLSGRPFTSNEQCSSHLALENVCVSRCYSCTDLSLWLHDEILYPHQSLQIEPNPDLPPDIRAEFEEAARTVQVSPRGAAALLRLCIQKLCEHLGEKSKKIDDAIASLVRKGLHTKIQKALDIVRVIGNEAVHPGTIDLRDDKAIALELFRLVNIIAETMITQPRAIDELYEKLPEAKRKAIEKRDASKALPKS